MQTVVMPKRQEDDTDVKFFDAEQVELIKKVSLEKDANGKFRYRLGLVIPLLLNTGMRIGEVLALTWSDIDFDKKTISVSKNLINVKNRDEDRKHSRKDIIQNSPKTKHS